MVSRILLSSSLVVVAACSTKGDLPATDGGNTGGDGGPCGGHGEPECPTDAGMPDYLNHWGGEIRLEYLETNTSSSVIFYSWFLEQQLPSHVAYPGEGCTQLLSYTNTTNVGTEINDGRTFMDVGPSITFSGPGAPGGVTLTKYENIADKRGLVMDIGYAKDGSSRNTVSPSTMLRGGLYDITFADGTMFPGQLKLPTQWETVGGNLYFGPNVVNNIPKDTDVTWKYSYVEEELLTTAILLFGGTNTAGERETWFCVYPVTGEIHLPASEVAKFPPSGNMQAALISHQKLDFRNRVVDLLGITCRQTPYTIQQ